MNANEGKVFSRYPAIEDCMNLYDRSLMSESVHR